MAFRVKAISRRLTNPARPYPELRTWKAAVFFCHRGRRPCPTLPVTAPSGWELNPGPTCTGCSMSMRCDATPIVCSTCQRHFHRTCSRLTCTKKVYSWLHLLLLFPGSCCTTSYGGHRQKQRISTPMSTLSHKDSTWHLSHYVSTVFPPHTQEVLWHIPLCGQPLLAVPHMLSTNYLHPYPTHDGNN